MIYGLDFLVNKLLKFIKTLDVMVFYRLSQSVNSDFPKSYPLHLLSCVFKRSLTPLDSRFIHNLIVGV